MTVFLQTAGGAARVGTVLVESDDVMFQAQYIIGLLLNMIIFLQFFCYWGSGKRVSVSADAKGKKD